MQGATRLRRAGSCGRPSTASGGPGCGWTASAPRPSQTSFANSSRPPAASVLSPRYVKHGPWSSVLKSGLYSSQVQAVSTGYLVTPNLWRGFLKRQKLGLIWAEERGPLVNRWADVWRPDGRVPTQLPPPRIHQAAPRKLPSLGHIPSSLRHSLVMASIFG